MINNYFEDQQEYHASNQVYVHPISRNSLHLGDMSAAIDTELIQKMNIRTVITAAACMDHINYDPQLNVKHVVYDLNDAKSENIAQHFESAHQLIETELQQGSVLVHCAAGISRVNTTLVIAYLMKSKQMTFHQAIALVRQNRPKVCPNLGFERQLKSYEKNLFRKNKNSHSLVLRKGPKTSQEHKHHLKKHRQIELPEITALGRTQVKNIVFDPFFESKETRGSQRVRLNELPKRNQENQDFSTKLRPLKIRKTKSLMEREESKSQRPSMVPSLAVGAQSVCINRMNLGQLKTDRFVRRRQVTRIPNEPFRL